MIYLREALPALLLVALAGIALARVARTVSARRARWQSLVRSAASGRVVVEVARASEPTQVVAELDPAADDFDERLYEAKARAENLAAALNVARR